MEGEIKLHKIGVKRKGFGRSHTKVVKHKFSKVPKNPWKKT
jgi:hypothetical protein